MATEHYSIPEANRNSGFLTSDWNAALQKIDAEMWKLFQFRGNLTSSGDANNLLGDGYWRIEGSVPTNVPSGYTWCFLFQIVVGSVTNQYIIKPSSMGFLMREYTGSPQVWSSWRVASGIVGKTRIDYGSSSYVEYWKNGNIGCVYINYKESDGEIAAWTSKTIATIPAGFRPLQETAVRAILDRAGDEGTVAAVNSAGACIIQTRHTPFNTDGDVLQGYITYPIMN